MDLQTCLKKMQLVGVLAFATVDSEGAPQMIYRSARSCRIFLHVRARERFRCKLRRMEKPD